MDKTGVGLALHRFRAPVSLAPDRRIAVAGAIAYAGAAHLLQVNREYSDTPTGHGVEKCDRARSPEPQVHPAWRFSDHRQRTQEGAGSGFLHYL